MSRSIFLTLFTAVFCVTLGVGLVVPLLPVYADELGAGGFLIGLMFGSFSISRTLLLPVFGALSDRHGRKPFLVTGLFFYFVLSLLFACVENVFLFVLIRLGQGVGSAMILPVAQAYIGDITPLNREGRIMGLFNISLFAGLAVGPLLGGMVKDAYGIEASFISMGAFSLLGCVLCLVLLPSERDASGVRRSVPSVPYRLLLRDPTVAALSLFRFSFTTCVGVIWAFLPLWAGTRAGLGSSAIGVVVSLNVAMGGILMAPMGILADRVPKRALLVIGGLVAAGSVYYLSLAHSFWTLFIGNALFGAASGTALPAVMAIAVTTGRRTRAMGSLMGLLATAHSGGMLFGALLSGVLLDWSSFERIFQAGAVVMIMGTFSLIWVDEGSENTKANGRGQASEEPVVRP